MEEGTVPVIAFRKKIVASVALGLGLSLSHVAMADGLSDGLKTCRTIGDVTARASCYDRIVDTLPPTPKAPVAATPSAVGTAVQRPATPPPVAQTPEQRFGEKDLPVKKRLAEEEQAPDELLLKVTGVRNDQAGYGTFTLENGQVWRQVESSSLRVSNGARVKIKSGTLGAYYLSLESGNKSFRVKRVN